MAEYRMLHTRMWADGWFMDLAPEGKLLFVYLFSNQRASVCGLYELPIRLIAFETGLDKNTILKCLDVFSRADKVYYDFKTSVVWVANMPKYQGTASPKLLTKITSDINAVPECDLKTKFLQRYPNYTVSIPYGYGSDTLISESESESESESVEEGGTGGETKSPAVLEFIAHFRSFNGKREQQRWETLVESIGLARAREIAAWAERKEIHMVNRGGLMDSLETAAKKWTDKTSSEKPSLTQATDKVIKELVYGKP